LALSANKSPKVAWCLGRATVLAAPAAFLIAGCGSSSSTSADRTQAVTAAKHAYAAAKREGEDLARGPCIAERLPGLSDWVADIAHDPRRPVDDVPRNQCARFRAGDAHHFVELTPAGQLIRAE
jgi:hypothetical protein